MKAPTNKPEQPATKLKVRQHSRLTRPALKVASFTKGQKSDAVVQEAAKLGL